MDLKRGEVYLIRMELPRMPTGTAPERERAKYFLVLQDTARDPQLQSVAGVLCNTKKPATRPPRASEVEVGIPEGFQHATVVDCRFPFSFERTFVAGGQYLTTLSPRVMGEVDQALAHGLQMI